MTSYRTIFTTFIPYIILSLICRSGSVASESTLSASGDLFPECEEWAERGDCNPTGRPHFMQKNCRESCYKKTYREPEHRIISDDQDQEFYDLRARDANGKVFSMENLEGYVTVIVNAARVCQYTESFYDVLEHLHSINPWALEILAFPFDRPDIDLSSCREDIERFEKKDGHKIHIMETIDINGPDTHPIYRYLKKLFDVKEMDPNFSHYFFINPDGNYVELHYGISYNSLKTFVDHHVKAELGNSGDEF